MMRKYVFAFLTGAGVIVDAVLTIFAPSWRITIIACAVRRRQRDVLCDVMLSARQCETWLTLEELAKLTHYPQASISAQLRHLRKPEYGGFVVEKRPRALDAVLRGEDFGTVWEYQLRRAIRRRSQVSERKAVEGNSRCRARLAESRDLRSVLMERRRHGREAGASV
jgi:hypothetical protein